MALALLIGLPATLWADYTLVLKNGRRITVEAYREEGGMIKFSGMGGEIGISRDQIQTITKAGEAESRGMSIQRLEAAPSAQPPAARTETGEVPRAEAKIEEKGEAKEKALSPEEQRAQERAKEEKEFQNKVSQLTEQIKAVRDRYSVATRGSSGAAPTLLQNEEAIKARTDDLMSRLRDTQYNPSGPSDSGGIKLSTPSTFSGLPPTVTELLPGTIAPRVDVPLPGYSNKERELSDLRNQLNQLQRDRERLIEQMKQKNLDTGSLFLE